MAVMLSRPQGSVGEVPLFKFLSKNCLRQSLLLKVLSSLTKWLVSCSWSSPYFSQMPSQPMRMSSSSPVRATSMMSGMQVIGCWLNGRPSTFLWLKSPIERVRFSPFTRPWMIGTPVFAIRAFSTSFSGLWSNDSGTHRPPCHSAARESPAFAHTTFSRVTAITTAVAPELSSSSFAGRPSSSDLYCSSSAIPGLNFSSSSTLMKASVSASPILPSCSVFRLASTSTKCLATNLETSPPPWPSNTPKRAMCSCPGTSSSAMKASSMFFLQPCISQVAYLQLLFSPQLVFLVVIGFYRQLFPMRIESVC